MNVYYNQFDVRPAAGGTTPSNGAATRVPARPLRTPEHAARYLARRERQRRQRVRDY